MSTRSGRGAMTMIAWVFLLAMPLGAQEFPATGPGITFSDAMARAASASAARTAAGAMARTGTTWSGPGPDSLLAPFAGSGRTGLSPSSVSPTLLGRPSLFVSVPTAYRRSVDAYRVRPLRIATRPSETEGAPTGGDAPTAPQDDVWRDAWGQPRSFGLAAAEAYLGNFLPWAFNEIVPGRAALKISQISPRSWARNLDHGWAWDDNAFKVNHFAHPFQGNMYFNAARANGYGYWTGLAFATAGSFLWECCGETHLMSINDWYNTALGGAAVGEMLYRTSSMVLDNTATGTGRAWREVGGFLMNPARGLTRLVTGNATRVYANPIDPLDRRPTRLENVLSFGLRTAESVRTSDTIRVNDGRETHAFFDMQLVSGSLFDLDRGKPFDFFTLQAQLNFRQAETFGKFTIRGNLWHKNLTTTDERVSKLILVQDFDYENNSAYEFGGQGVSMMYLSRKRRGERSAFVFSGAATWMVMGGVSSEFAFLADVEGLRERLREYDFGTGPGARVGFQFLRDGNRFVEAAYRVQYLHTLNGSNLNGGNAKHFIQMARLRALVPYYWHSFGLGAEGEWFVRDSYFASDMFSRIRERVPRWQFFVTWNPQLTMNQN
jgi:Domain of unknown function (DUF3943)